MEISETNTQTEINIVEDRIKIIEEKIDKMSIMVRRMYLIFVWTGIITVAAFILPLIGLLFVIPKFISSYTSMAGM